VTSTVITALSDGRCRVAGTTNANGVFAGGGLRLDADGTVERTFQRSGP
jgi:hypothetical protein